jgi:predicted nucleic acid-binding protein
VALTAEYLADKSALARLTVPTVAQRVRPLIEEGLIATCAVIDLELLYSAQGPSDYEAVRTERRAFEDIPITPKVMDRALAVQRGLARTGQHRVAIPDLIIAAAAESASMTMLHYDSDFERIAGLTGQDHEWVVPRGSI